MINVNKKYYNCSGIYYIVNISTNRVYVGSAISIGERIKHHRNELNKNKHRNAYLQNAFNKYSEDSFIAYPVEILYNKNILLEREQHYIDIQKKIFGRAYNINPIAGSSLGYKHTPETKKHLSDTKKGNKNPQFGNVGEKNPNSKLTIENVHFIRSNVLNYNLNEMSKMFNVSTTTISGIIKNKHWINI